MIRSLLDTFGTVNIAFFFSVIWLFFGGFVVSALNRRAQANGHQVDYLPTCSVQCTLGNPTPIIAIVFWPITAGIYLVYHRRPVNALQ